MGEAWIIDALRTPRGRGKQETGAPAGIHPPGLVTMYIGGGMGITTILERL